MSERGLSYVRKLKVPLTDIMYDVLTSPLLKEMYKTDNPGEILAKMFEEGMRLKIERGDFEDHPEKEEIYRAFKARPKPQAKKSS